MKQIIPYKKDIVFKTNIANITSISLEHEEKIREEEVSGDFLIFGEYKIHNDTTEKELFKYRLPFSIDFTENIDSESIKIDIEDFNYEIIENDVLRVNIDFSLNATEIIEEKEEELDEGRELEDELEEEDDIKEELDDEIEMLDETEVDLLDEELKKQLEEYIDLRKEVEELSREITSDVKRKIIDDEEDAKDKEDVLENAQEEVREKMIDESDKVQVVTLNEKVKDEKNINERIIKEDEIIMANETMTNVKTEVTESKTEEKQEIVKTADNEYVTYHIHIVGEYETIDDILRKYECSLDVLKMYNDVTNITVGDKIIIPDLENE